MEEFPTVIHVLSEIRTQDLRVQDGNEYGPLVLVVLKLQVPLPGRYRSLPDSQS
jgi:hypothetical protein